MKFKLVVPVFLTIALLLAACSSATPTGSSAEVTQAPVEATMPPAEATMPPAAAAPMVNLAQAGDLGSILVDEKGMTLYLYTKDTPNTSVCYDKCAEAWPPLLADGPAAAGSGVDAAMLGLTSRTDGTSQVTYNGWPLYYYIKDMQPGDVTGQNVGGVWFVVSAAGEQVAQPAAEPTATTMSSAADSNANANANPAPAAGDVSVDIANFAYAPSPLTVPVGTTVTWVNKDGAAHNVVADNGEFTSGTLQQGDSFSFTFSKAGTYPYYCSFHGGPGGSGMSGQVIVTP